MNPVIILESTDEQNEPAREVLCSVWPLSQDGDEVAIGTPIFSDHMVQVGASLSGRENSTLALPEPGSYLVDVGYPNGHSLRTTITVDENQRYRLLVSGLKRVPITDISTLRARRSDGESSFGWVPRVLAAGTRRVSVRKQDIEVSAYTQRDEITLTGLYEFASNIKHPAAQSESIFTRAITNELRHEITLGNSGVEVERSTARRWLIVSGKGKAQTLIAYPDGWACEDSDPFKLIMERKSDEGKQRFKWSASLKLMDPVYGSLVEYLTRRDISSTLSISESERGKAATALYRKKQNPFSAVAAAYLLALSGVMDRKHYAWVENLCFRYMWMPDGAIALGWISLNKETPDGMAYTEAKWWFSKAWSRGLPYYTVGLHILIDGLTLLYRVDPSDQAVRSMLSAAKAADVACVRTEPFTTLEISRYVSLPRIS